LCKVIGTDVLIDVSIGIYGMTWSME